MNISFKGFMQAVLFCVLTKAKEENMQICKQNVIAMKVVQENKRQILQKVRRLCRKHIFVNIDERFAINGI